MNKIIWLSMLLFVLAACSGGSGENNGSVSASFLFTGNTEQAQLTTDNVEEIGLLASSLVFRAKTIEGLSFQTEPISEQSASVSTQSNAYASVNTAQDSSNLVDVSYLFCSAGTAQTSARGINESGESLIDTIFEQCRILGQESLVYDGTISVQYADIEDENTTFTISTDAFSAKFGESAEPIQFSHKLTCIGSSICEVDNIDIVFNDSEIHRFADIEISGNPNDGYEGGGLFFHEIYGYIEFDLTAVRFGSCEELPDGGSIALEGQNGSFGEITFLSDCSYLGAWNNQNIAGSF